MGSVKLPLEIQTAAWTASSTSSWGATLTGPVKLEAGNTYLIILKFPVVPSSYENYPVAFGSFMSTTVKPITSRGTVMWIFTPPSTATATAICTGYSASVSYTETSYAGLTVIKIA